MFCDVVEEVAIQHLLLAAAISGVLEQVEEEHHQQDDDDPKREILTEAIHRSRPFKGMRHGRGRILPHHQEVSAQPSSEDKMRPRLNNCKA